MADIKNDKKRIAVFASGFGSNLQALIDKGSNYLNGEIVLVFSNNRNAYALKRARKSGIKTVFLDKGKFESRNEYDRKIINLLEKEEIDLVVLAGYMLMLSKEFVKEFKSRIINIHPALLPSFKGTHAIEEAYQYGVKVTGVTVHFVDEGMDSGPIILQEPVKVEQGYTLEELEEKIHQVEHKIYPLAIRYFCEDKLKIQNRKVIIGNK